MMDGAPRQFLLRQKKMCKECLKKDEELVRLKAIIKHAIESLRGEAYTAVRVSRALEYLEGNVSNFEIDSDL